VATRHTSADLSTKAISARTFGLNQFRASISRRSATPHCSRRSNQRTVWSPRPSASFSPARSGRLEARHLLATRLLLRESPHDRVGVIPARVGYRIGDLATGGSSVGIIEVLGKCRTMSLSSVIARPRKNECRRCEAPDDAVERNRRPRPASAVTCDRQDTSTALSGMPRRPSVLASQATALTGEPDAALGGRRPRCAILFHTMPATERIQSARLCAGAPSTNTPQRRCGDRVLDSSLQSRIRDIHNLEKGQHIVTFARQDVAAVTTGGHRGIALETEGHLGLRARRRSRYRAECLASM